MERIMWTLRAFHGTDRVEVKYHLYLDILCFVSVFFLLCFFWGRFFLGSEFRVFPHNRWKNSVGATIQVDKSLHTTNHFKITNTHKSFDANKTL